MPAGISTSVSCATGECFEGVDITLVMPFAIPIPPSPDSSRVILAGFARHGIEFVPGHAVSAVDTAANEAVHAHGSRLGFLFLGIPVRRAHAVVVEAGMTEDG